MMERNTNELWKAIPEYEGLYEVSNLGNVRRILFVNNVVSKPKITNKKLVNHNNGYYIVFLSNNGKSKPMLAHRAVAKAFIDNPQNKPHINHLNGNKKDNRVENLEWCTPSENMKHAFRTNLAIPSARGKYGGDSAKAIRVDMFDKNNNYIMSFDSLIDGAKYIGKNKSCHIVSCCKGKLKTAHGYIWRYADQQGMGAS